MYEYKGQEIQFDTIREEWYFEDIREKSYKAVCVQIDKLHRADWTPREAFILRGIGTGLLAPVKGIVTSIAPGNHKAFVTRETGERTQEPIARLCEVTPESEEIVNAIEINCMVLERTVEETKALEKKLRPLKI